jgi:hypothetical protein
MTQRGRETMSAKPPHLYGMMSGQGIVGTFALSPVLDVKERQEEERI